MSKVNKSNFEIIKSLKKANKINREKMATRAGFKSSEQYIQFLEGNSAMQVSDPQSVKTTPIPKKIAQKPVTPKQAFSKPTIHIVDVLDASGSMETGGKYTVATEGIMSGISDLDKNKDVNFTYSLTEFVQGGLIRNHFFMSKTFPTYVPFNGANGWNTPLYKTVYDLIVKLQAHVQDNEKVLLKIYTDGIDNNTPGFRQTLAKLIKEVNSKNFTVTFVATDSDLSKIQRDLSVDESNTLAVSNNKKGFEKAFEASRGATMLFAAKVSKGEDVLKGFYKKSGTL